MAFSPVPPLTEHRSSRESRRRSAGLLLVAALLSGGLSTFILPAASASAEAIDCGYTPGLADYIGSGRDGVTCMGGGSRSPGTVYGSGSLPGQSVPGGAFGTSTCSFPTPSLPDRFYGWGKVTAFTASYDFVHDDGSKWRTTQTSYYRDGRPVAIRTIETSAGKPLEMTFIDLTLINSVTGAGVALESTFNCRTDSTWVDSPPKTYADPGLPLGVPTTSVSHTLDTRANMAPVPFHPGQFFLRIDLTDNHPMPSSTPAQINLDLTSYSVASIVSLPRDGSCPSAYPLGELCVTPQITPGETQTFLFVVQQRAGADPQAPIVVETFHEGWHRVGLLNRPGLATSVTVAAPAA